ncbi:hypothetical protein A9Q68_04910 [Streptococcus bovimastitidis]|uniref:Regulatory protein ylbF n=1 Tax=Streptococcus bovimastitidis TaxID=1856638 RepID=A0A1L8MQ83_9STRE|nr:YlbF family regulator [Streptococcus bovimastitidis]OJF72886.1 hypothetical protein A9Q68_04910 [Streptococcus bovimastitidis]
MLVINQDLLVIDDAIDRLVEDIKKTGEFQSYLEVKRHFTNDPDLQREIGSFQILVREFSDQDKYASYRPESKMLKKLLLAKKRELDLNPLVVALRLAEVDLQAVLASITNQVAHQVSETIYVDSGLPLATRHEKVSRGIYQNIKEKDIACLNDKKELE